MSNHCQRDHRRADVVQDFQSGLFLLAIAIASGAETSIQSIVEHRCINPRILRGIPGRCFAAVLALLRTIDGWKMKSRHWIVARCVPWHSGDFRCREIERASNAARLFYVTCVLPYTAPMCDHDKKCWIKWNLTRAPSSETFSERFLPCSRVITEARNMHAHDNRVTLDNCEMLSQRIVVLAWERLRSRALIGCGTQCDVSCILYHRSNKIYDARPNNTKYYLMDRAKCTSSS